MTIEDNASDKNSENRNTNDFKTAYTLGDNSIQNVIKEKISKDFDDMRNKHPINYLSDQLYTCKKELDLSPDNKIEENKFYINLD